MTHQRSGAARPCGASIEMESTAPGRPVLAWLAALWLLARVGDGAAAPSPEASWPEFHGARRDNRSPETGLLRQWPENGPDILWRYADCGQGYACVSVAESLVFTTGDFGDEEMLLALDLGGELRWKRPHGPAWKGPQPGSRTTPTYSEGMVYHLNPTGRLSALAASSGALVWTVELQERFEGRAGLWGFTENVVVEGDRLFCLPGGRAGRVVALDKKTGKTVWANTEITDRVAYSSPIVVTHNGERQLIALAHETVFGVDIRTGELLWSHPHPSTCDQNVTSPLYHEGVVYVTSGHRGGGRAVQIQPDGRGVREIWFGTDLDNCHGGVMLLDGFLYGSGCRLYKKGLLCVDFATGKTVYNAREIGKVSVTYADGLLYCLGNDASMALVEVTPSQAKVISRFEPPWQNKPPCLSHPVVCGGRLYIRHLNELLVYDLRKDN